MEEEKNKHGKPYPAPALSKRIVAVTGLLYLIYKAYVLSHTHTLSLSFSVNEVRDQEKRERSGQMMIKTSESDG